MVSSSSSGDLFMLNARNTGRAQADDDDDDELASRRQVPHSRAGRPAKRPRDDLAQALRGDSDAGPQQAPTRKSGGSVPPPAPAPASPTDEVDAWLKAALPTTVAPPRPATLTAEQQALLRRNELLRQELSRAVEVDLEPEPVAPAEDVVDDDRHEQFDDDAGDDEPPEEEEEAPAGQGLRLKLRMQTGDELKFSVKPDTLFGKLFDAFFAKHPELDRGRTRFRFDGDNVAPTATPTSLDIDDESIIDVCVV